MSQERFDVVLKVLNGPLASMGEQTYKGPLVRLGANPGPGGLALTGYRGIDARQAVITAYGEGEATIGPVGTNQIRLAPHPHVNWKEIDPLTGPEYLNQGCAVHLGPVGRGATVQFIRVEKLGVWTAGRVGSAADSVKAVEVSAPVAAKKAAPQRSVARIAAATLPIWFFGCFGLTVVTVGAAALIGVYLREPEVARLGPIVEGEEYYEHVDPANTKMDEETLEGLQEPFRRLAVAPSAERAKQAGVLDVKHITDPSTWDERFFSYTSAQFEQYMKSKRFFRRLDVVRKPYAQVLGQLREAGLPEVIAALPYTESRYDPEAQSWACAKGYWQFMPEVAFRIEKVNGQDFRIRDCQLRRPDGSTFNWTPSTYSPPAPLRQKAPYIDKNLTGIEPEVCLIPKQGGCRIDDRRDLERSTKAAIFALGEAWQNETIARSGGATIMTIVSHNGGYDDSRFGKRKSFNVLPAFEAWSKRRPESEHHLFYGENIRCADGRSTKFCGSRLAPESQHYGYTVVAQHMVAVCYYGKNYRDTFAEFRSWDSLVNGYCDNFAIPTAKAVGGF
ncbi:MAG: hypothetical protein EA397_03200 [Deltaproteobacteria bacterium]|nr:MAG: hypothetical protein EA397_03200 [Deltaproteobacteria bacterium]